MSEKNPEEKRDYKRVSDSFIVTYQLKSPTDIVLQMGNKEYDAIALDISEGGLGVDAGNEIPIGAELLLRFMIWNDLSLSDADRRREIIVSGEARSCEATAKNNYRISLVFKDLLKEDRAFLSRYVQDQLLGKF